MSLLLQGAGSAGGLGFYVPALVPSAWFSGDVGATAASWTDRAPSGHALSAAGAAQPTAGTATLNGLPGLRFNGLTNVMASAAWTVGVTTTWYVVSRHTGAFVLGDAVTDGLTGFQLLSRRSSTDMGVYSGSTLPVVTTTPQAAHVYTAKFSNPSTTLTVAVDGGTAASGGAAVTEAGGVTVGATRGGSFAAVDVFEVIVISGATTAPQDAAVAAALKAKWGTP